MELFGDREPPRAGTGESRLRVMMREALAVARQTVLLHHDTTEPVIPEDVAAGDDVVVFLHGLFATAGVLRPLRAAVARRPWIHTAAMTYFPGPSVEALASRLGALVHALPGHARLHLVGHSLGGVVTRYYALEANDTRVVQTISMATPFAGVRGATWLRLESLRDLQPESLVLRRIRLHPQTDALPHLSIIAGSDTLMESPITHALPGSEVLLLPGRGHNSLLFDLEAAQAVEQRVLAHSGR